MSENGQYNRGERIAGVVFVAGLGIAALVAAGVYAGTQSWLLAALVGLIIVLAGFFAAAIVAAVLSRRRR